jgi:hypothetical protein
MLKTFIVGFEAGVAPLLPLQKTKLVIPTKMYRIVYNLVDIPAEHHLNRTSSAD